MTATRDELTVVAGLMCMDLLGITGLELMSCGRPQCSGVGEVMQNPTKMDK